jgi:subtilisin family serine protease
MSGARANENTPWDGTVRFRLDQSGRPFAFVDEVVVIAPNEDAVNEVRGDATRRLLGAGGIGDDPATRVTSDDWLPSERVLIRAVPDPVAEAELWRRRGYEAQPNHAVFATPVHGNPAAHPGGGTLAHPGGGTLAHPGGGTLAHPGGGTLAHPGGGTLAHPFGFYGPWGPPWMGFPAVGMYAPCPACGGSHTCSPGASFDPRQARAPRKNLAEPAEALPSVLPLEEALAPGRPRCEIVVLDTGLSNLTFRPDDLPGDRYDVMIPETDHEEPDAANDGLLDPVAGHGTFITGLVSRLAPEANVRVMRVLSPYGLGDDEAIAKRIDAIDPVGSERSAADPGPEGELRKPFEVPMILSMSFGAYTEDDRPPLAMAQAIARFIARGGVAVASAGNDASCRISYPAGLPDVIGVAALAPDGAAPFTNHGSWVRACAPGQDVVSRFFKNPHLGEDPNRATIPSFGGGWASWSGTSFAAPIVAAVLARAVCREGVKPHEAVARHIDDPRLLRLPGLGTVINEH